MKLKNSPKLYNDYAIRTLKNKLLLLLGDWYCEAWDFLRGVYETRDEKRIAQAKAMNRMVLIADQCMHIQLEVEGR